jgi:hypothetical protein
MSRDRDNEEEYSPAFDFIVTKAQEYQGTFESHPSEGVKSKNQEITEREKERGEWPEWCKQAQAEEKPLDRYCRVIRRIRADFELTFEEWKKLQTEVQNLESYVNNVSR